MNKRRRFKAKRRRREQAIRRSLKRYVARRNKQAQGVDIFRVREILGAEIVSKPSLSGIWFGTQ